MFAKNAGIQIIVLTEIPHRDIVPAANMMKSRHLVRCLSSASSLFIFHFILLSR